MKHQREERITNKDFQKLFPKFNRKTLARDLKDLADKKLVRMKGERKGVYYELNI